MLAQYTIAVVMLALLAPPPNPPLPPEKGKPGEALYGEWEVVDMIFHTKVQDFGGQPGGWFIFEPGGFIRLYNPEERDLLRRDRGFKKVVTMPCAIRAREIDIDTDPLNSMEPIKEALYEMKNGVLRIAYREDSGKRPLRFDEALHDPNVTLFVLKKVEK